MDIMSVLFWLIAGVSLLIYWNARTEFRWIILLIDNIVLYFVFATKPWTFIYLFLSVILVWFTTFLFDKCNSECEKKVLLVFTLVIVFGILIVLKYLNLFVGTINFWGGYHIRLFSFATPIALSYYTFSLIGYLLDVFWRVEKRETNLLKLLLFTSYFPLMVSGPICKYVDFHNSLSCKQSFSNDTLNQGILRILYGLAKKLIVSNRLSIIVNYMFEKPNTYSGYWILISACLFSFQLYFDFSGCMDIVIGLSSCFGIHIEENFKAPFFSKTLQEFWQRWHITLGGWMKNYFMYPLLKSNLFFKLGIACKKKFGKKGKKIISYITMFLVWNLTGLWHGSSWKYIIGVGWWCCLVIILEQCLKEHTNHLIKRLNIKEENIFLNTFRVVRTIVFFSIACIFFYAQDMKTAIDYLICMFKTADFSGIFFELINYSNVNFGGKIGWISFGIVFLINIYVDSCIYQEKESYFRKMKDSVRWLIYIVVPFFIIMEGVYNRANFLYANF